MTRVRTSSQVDPVTPLITSVKCQSFTPVNGICQKGATTYVTIDRSRSLKRVDKSMTDVEIIDFHKRQRKGELFFNPLSMSEVTTWQNHATIDYGLYQKTNPPCQYSYTEDATLHYPSEDLIPFSDLLNFSPNLHSEMVARAEALAVTNAWANVSAADLNAYASLGEFSETISSLVSIFKRLIKIIKAIKRLDLKALLGEISPKELADRYMEARYAIRPLIYETNAIIGFFNKKVNKNPKRITFRGSATLTDSAQQSRLRVASSRLTHSVVDYISIEVKSSAGVLTSVDKLSWPHMLGFTEPVEALWELIPLSFVVDWFFNVGKTLAAWTPNIGFNTLGSWVTTQSLIFQTSVVTGSSYILSGYDTKYIAHGAMIGKNQKLKTRKISPHREVIPRLNIKLDLLKLIDLGLILKNLLN